ncbi:F-box only protein 17 [Phyllostomus hastatus]|uniref:F-box only protein 17 n=1 Tax=Phyllostomus hastatus TaxID=9423 RepID=UPI001E682A03|nr:F-box only protein 17 [Phyllostomus hastatus]XP_045702640.1 F-box only protein 17 [Phyllostomus hastatus]
MVLQEAAVDLVMEGVCQELLDSAQVEICVADRWGTQENYGCIYWLQVHLLDVRENEVVNSPPHPTQPFSGQRGCQQVSHVFTDFGKGIQYPSSYYGRDTHSWVGHYSALVTPSRTCLS